MFYFLIWKAKNLKISAICNGNKLSPTTNRYLLWKIHAGFKLRYFACGKQSWNIRQPQNYLIFEFLQCDEKMHSNTRSLPKGKLYNVFWETPNPIYIFQAARLWCTAKKILFFHLYAIYQNIRILGIGKDDSRDYPFCFLQKKFL